MLTKTLSEAKKKKRAILIKAMNNDIGSIDSSKDSWNPAQISERAKDISYIKSLIDSWNPAQLNEALKMLDLPVIDTWNPAQIEEQRRNLVFYLTERTLTRNPITLKILGNLTPEVTGLKVTMNPIQDLHGQSAPYPAGGGKNKCPEFPYPYTAQNPFVEYANEITFTGITFSLTFSGSFANIGAGFLIGYDENGTPSYSNAIGTLKKVSDNTNIQANTTYTNERFYFSMTQTVKIKKLALTNYPSFATGTKFENVQLESGTSVTAFAPYANICPITGRTEVSVTRTAGEDVETKTHQYSETIYGGVDDFVNGGATSEWGYIAEYDGETLPGMWISDRDVYAPDTTPTTGAEVAYELATPTTIQTSAEDITLLKGENVLSTDGDSIELKYKQNF